MHVSSKPMITPAWRLSCLALLLLPILLRLAPARAETQDADATLTVATREVPPFAMRKNGAWEGIAIDLWNRVAGDLGYRNEFRPMGLTQMLQAVEAGEVDAAAAALTMTSEREAKLNFSFAFHTSGLGIAVRRNPETSWIAVLERVFSSRFAEAMTTLLLLLTLVGILVWLAERRRNPQFQGGLLKGIGSGLWWSAVTMTTVGYGDKSPVTPAGRLLGMVWMFSSIIVISGITAAIATSLTVGTLTRSITGMDDLYRSRVLTLAGSTSETYLENQLIHYRTAPDLTAALEALEHEEADALVYDMPILRYYINAGYADKLQVLPQVLQRQDYGFALPTGSKLLEGVNRELLAVISSPDWSRLLERYLGRQD